MHRSLQRLLVAVAPVVRRQWILAMLSEAEHLSFRNSIGWYVAAARIAFVSRIAHSTVIQAGAFATAMIVVDWVWGTFVPALALITLSAATIRKSSAALVVAAGTLPLAHAVANWVPFLRPAYQFASLDLNDWITLAAVGGVGVCAVKIADTFRRLQLA